MSEYIDLNRTFSKIEINHKNGFSIETDIDVSNFTPISWKNIIEQKLIVILAKAGSGKTTEFKKKAEKLHEAGKNAFFVSISSLVTSDLETAIEQNSNNELDIWKQSNEIGYFFLDSVDEARLKCPKDFEIALKRFKFSIKDYLERAHIYITSRPTEWQANYDINFIKELLTRPKLDKNDKDDVHIYRLDPLTDNQRKQYAQFCKVNDVAKFMNALADSNIEEFLARPADIEYLVGFWNDKGYIGDYYELIERYIEKTLEEKNTIHEHISTLSRDKVLYGATMLAAAVTFTKYKNILLTDENIRNNIEQYTIKPREILTEWTTTEINSLLSRPIFDEGIYGTVRFHHQMIIDYLTAKWLLQLINERKNRRSIEKLIFTEKYGHQLIIPAMRPIAAWLGGWNQSIFEKIIKIDPKILFEFGDPSFLDIDKRKKLLESFASFYKNRDYTGLRPELIQLKRLANQSLQPVIYKLLKSYRNHTDIRQLLLRIIWQGSITGCEEIALEFALDDKIDSFTRACAIRAIGASSTDDEKTKLAKIIIKNSAMIERSLLEAAIRVFFPKIISISDVLTILENVNKPTLRSGDHLSYQLDRIPNQIDENESLELLHGIENLLSRPPYKDENYARFSSKYSWLFGLSIKLIERVARINIFDVSILRILSYIHYAQDLGVDYTNYRVKEDFFRIIAKNKKLKYELFWYEIEQKRNISKDPIINLSYPESEILSVDDMEYFLEAIQNRELPDDKLICLNVLTQFYYNLDCKPEIFEKIQHVIKGNNKLEEQLKININNYNNTQKQIKAPEEYRENENIQENKYLEARSESIRLLKADPERINEYNGVSEGLFSYDIKFLYYELKNLEKDHDQLAVSQWALLELEFGHEVAIAFRNYCIKFWRLYTPKLRSQVDNPNSIPLAINIGLSGLTMDAQVNKDWVKNLTTSDVKSAIYYTLWEFGKLPNWIELLLLKHGDVTRNILINEMKRELAWSSKQPLPYSVISRLRWGENNLSDALNEDIMSLLEKLETIKNINSLAEILTILFQNKKPWTERFLTLTKNRYKVATLDSYKSLWLAAWLCIEANSAIKELKNWLTEPENINNAETRISRVLNYILGDRSLNRDYERNSFMRPNMLLRLIKMTFRYINPYDDLVHDGVYHPNARDYAERVRGQLIDILFNIPGRPTYEALKELSSFFETINLQLQRDYMLIRAEQRAEYDRATELRAWVEKDVVDFAREAEIFPKSEEDLFNLALSRLDDFKLDIEEGDYSNAKLLQKAEDEPQLRTEFMRELDRQSKGKYTVASEEEKTNKTRTDIRFHYGKITPVPIELKIADKWTIAKLKERCENQLVRDYMRLSHYGIYLIVFQGSKPYWVDEKKKKYNFNELIKCLEDEIRIILGKYSYIKELKLIGIDLTRRERKSHKSS